MPEVGRGVAARAVANADGTLEYSWNVTSVTNTIAGQFDYNLDTAVVNAATSYVVAQASSTRTSTNSYFDAAGHYDVTGGFVRTFHYRRNVVNESDFATSGMVLFQSAANVAYMHNGPVSTLRAGDLAANHASVNSYATAFVTIEPTNSDTITNSYGVSSATSSAAGYITVNIDTSKYSGVITEAGTLTRPDVQTAPFAGYNSGNSTAGALIVISSASSVGFGSDEFSTYTESSTTDNQVRCYQLGTDHVAADPQICTIVVY